LSYRIVDTYQGIILAQLGMGVSFGAFWMRTAFRAVPDSLGEAARIDGAGSWAQLWRVYLPLARPAVLTLVLLSFLCLVSLPIIVLSFVFQRQFIRGMLSGSVKG
ncbi:MAG TPA: ABC transporter permease subunit, partial [Trebonia sp.]